MTQGGVFICLSLILKRAAIKDTNGQPVGDIPRAGRRAVECHSVLSLEFGVLPSLSLALASRAGGRAVIRPRLYLELGIGTSRRVFWHGLCSSL